MVGVLEIESVVKVLNGRKLLSNVYLKTQTSEIIAIFGRNGSGKSTFFKILYGVGLANEATIRWNAIKIKSPYRIKNLIAFSTQDVFLPNSMWVKSVLQLFCDGEIPMVVQSRFSDNLSRKVCELSGGEQKLLQLYAVLFSKSKFVILDEPFANLTPIVIDEIKTIIRQQSAEKCIILCDHSHDDVIELASQLFLLKDGSLKLMRDSAELKQEYFKK